MPFLSLPDVGPAFDSQSLTVFSRANINRIILENLEAWQIEDQEANEDDGAIPVKSYLQADVLDVILKNTKLQTVKLAFPYRTVFRFTWGEAPTNQILQSLDDKGYFSHYTAIRIHGLTDQIPKTVYFNVEQPATGGGGALSQEGIDRAFRGKCRVSNNVIELRDLKVCKLNGQNTSQLGVIRAATDGGYDVRVTNLERTLIDATVRPVYAGGVGEVAEAFKNAAKSLSVNKLVSYLRKLNYTYPYHQSIGYYLSRTGVYKQSQIDLLRSFPIEFDFYLNYQLKNPDYNKEWRLYVPKGF
jgi:hypothetical protein